MDGVLIYRTKLGDIELSNEKLIRLDTMCFFDYKTDDKLREHYSSIIGELDGEFIIKVDTSTLPLKELEYHREIEFNQDCLVSVRHDLRSKTELTNKLFDLMRKNPDLIKLVFERHETSFDSQDTMMFKIGLLQKNYDLQYKIIINFINSRLKDDFSYLFLRELYIYLLKGMENIKDKDSFTKTKK